jgi:hypothetical protein
MCPKMIAPRGRTKNPTAKIAKTASSPAVGSYRGKNWAARMVAK